MILFADMFDKQYMIVSIVSNHKIIIGQVMNAISALIPDLDLFMFCKLLCMWLLIVEKASY